MHSITPGFGVPGLDNQVGVREAGVCELQSKGAPLGCMEYDLIGSRSHTLSTAIKAEHLDVPGAGSLFPAAESAAMRCSMAKAQPGSSVMTTGMACVAT